ncbi:MAG: hypothetical protein JNK93_14115 [Planctomycetia bacterium]|nr:hypothetical protein [Planctomycetia bacterium]
MTFSVLTEPIATGFRASTGAPWSLFAEGPTEAAALNALRAMVDRKCLGGARIHQLNIPGDLRAAWDELASDPSRDEHVQAMADYGKTREAEEERTESERNRVRE